MEKNVLQMLEKAAARFPDKPAFSDENGFISYADAVLRAKAIGSCLAGRFVANGHRAVGVLMEKSKEMLITLMGVIYSGNFYIPIDADMPNDRIHLMLSTVDPMAIIVDETHLEKARQLLPEDRIILYRDTIQTPVDEAVLARIRYEAIDADPIYALFTSGSTGVPKGVVCCHRSSISYADWLIDTFAFDETTIFGNQSPFYFSMSVLDIYATIRSGAELHVIPKKLFAFPIKLLEHMNEARINTIYWVPTALSIVANMKALDKIEMPYLTKIMFAGDVMPTKQLNIWRRHIPNAMYVNTLGPTEATDTGVYYVVDRQFSDEEPLPIGKRCDCVDVMVINDQGKLVQDGEMGEMYIRGNFLALGYYNNPAKTAESFVQNPLNPHYPELVYKTGDLVSYNERGELMFHGRKDFQIKHRGNRIELGEIENVAASVPGVEMCACIYDKEKERIVLFYQGQGVTPQLIRRTMNDKVPSYMVPNVMLEMESLPKNQNGKLDRLKLTAYYREKRYQK